MIDSPLFATLGQNIDLVILGGALVAGALAGIAAFLSRGAR